MRLSQIATILSKSIPKLEIPGTNAGTNVIRVDNLVNVRNAIDELQETGLFKESIRFIENSDVYQSSLDSLIVSNTQFSNLSTVINNLKENASNLSEAIYSALPRSESEQTISIKLPDLLDFESLGKIMDQLKKAFSLPLADSEINDTIEIKAFESGSFWVDILVHTKEAVMLISAITWAGAYIYRQSIEGKKHLQFVASLDAKNNHLKSLNELLDAQIATLIEAEAQNIQSKYYNGDDPERLERLKLSIKNTSELIEKGTEIHPSLLASDNTSSMFPSFKNLNLVESKTKQISNE